MPFVAAKVSTAHPQPRPALCLCHCANNINCVESCTGYCSKRKPQVASNTNANSKIHCFSTLSNAKSVSLQTSICWCNLRSNRCQSQKCLTCFATPLPKQCSLKIGLRHLANYQSFAHKHRQRNLNKGVLSGQNEFNFALHIKKNSVQCLVYPCR